MSTSLQATISNVAKVIHQEALALATYTGQVNLDYELALASTDITKAFHDSRTLTATSEQLDLTSGLVDAFGASLVFASLKFVCIINTSATSNLTVFGGTTPTIPNTVVLSPGGSISLTSTFTVDSTHKFIKVDAGSATIVYSILLLGS